MQNISGFDTVNQWVGVTHATLHTTTCDCDSCRTNTPYVLGTYQLMMADETLNSRLSNLGVDSIQCHAALFGYEETQILMGDCLRDSKQWLDTEIARYRRRLLN